MTLNNTNKSYRQARVDMHANNTAVTRFILLHSAEQTSSVGATGRT